MFIVQFPASRVLCGCNLCLFNFGFFLILSTSNVDICNSDIVKCVNKNLNEKRLYVLKNIAMSSFNLSEIEKQLKETTGTDTNTGVSFAGRSLKFNNEEDAKAVVEAIRRCEYLEYLDLEGNTLGPDAAKAIAKALETKGAELKRALWKDLFTGRMKTEIPLALEYLGTGLCKAGTCLVELDLSDNAFGPIGVQGLAAFLSSSTCYTLRELRLNNNGLGISGGKMLAKALLDCHANSIKEGMKPLALKVFVAGRNRLENEGAKALASVFQQLKSLEEVVMPQNGIYHKGIAALAEGLSVNPGLRILNLNDNTVGPKGAQALAKALQNFPNLERLNLGDCLLKTQGALVLADALKSKDNHSFLTDLNMSFNEISTRGVEPIAKAMANKNQLTSLQLDGNMFGPEGRAVLHKILMASDKIAVLGSLDEDENEGDENEDSESNESEDENDEEKDEERVEQENKSIKKVSVEEFLKAPIAENLLLLKENKVQSFIEYAKSLSSSKDKVQDAKYPEELARIIMKVSALCGSGYVDARIEAERLTEVLYKELFAYATKNNRVSDLNNALLVNLGLIKSEDKNTERISWNLEGCFKALEKISQKDYFLSQTRDTLELFLEKPVKINKTKTVDPFQDAKTSLKTVLNRLQTT